MAISSFANPLLEDTNADVPSLVTPLTPMTGTGLSGLGASTAGLVATGQALIRGTQPQLAVSPASPAYFSASRKEIFRKGLTFAADDAARALEAEQLPQRDIAPPAGGDWVPLNEAAYGQYIQSITQPTLGRLASKSFGRGVDVAQALAGRGLQLAGAEELGGRIVAAQEEDLRKTAPFERQFTDIESGRDAVEWFVANFAQQGPNLIESVITAGLGFMAGSAAGGPLGGAGGALAGLMGKTAFKESVKAAAKKKAVGEVLTDAETKLLREAAGIAGAVTASYTQNLATGAADIYGELRDSGANADDIDARIKAIAGSIPYAALETLPEYLLASRILGGVRAPTAIPAGTSIGRRGLTVAGRGLTGFGIGGLAEGTTEAGQEALLLGLAGKELSGDEGINRLINSFAAGFAVGGPLGGVANLRGNKPANLLQPSQTAEPTSTKQELSPTIPQGAPAGTQGELFGGEPAFAGPPRPEPVSIEDRNALLNERSRLEGFIASAQRELEEAASGARTLDPARISALTSQVNAARTALTNVTQQLSQFAGLPPVVTPGAPGQLALFQPPPTGVQQLLGMRAAERQAQDILQQATVPGIPLQTGIEERLGIGRVPPVAATTALAGLQPVSTGFPSVQQALITAQEAQARQQGFEQAEAQRAAQRETEFQQMEAQAEAQRQLQLAQGQAPAAVPTPLRTVGPTEPQQLPLFGPRGLPRPSGAERLRRGVRPLPEPVQVVPVTPRESLQVAGQLPMFTQEGQPSVAALRGAGKRRKVRPQLQKGARQRPAEPAAKVRAVAEKIRKRQRIDTPFDNGDQFVGLMDAEGNLISGTYSYANGDVF